MRRRRERYKDDADPLDEVGRDYDRMSLAEFTADDPYESRESNVSPLQSTRRYDSSGRYVPLRNRLRRRRGVNVNPWRRRHLPTTARVWYAGRELIKERERLAEPWRCANLDGRNRAGQSVLCAECLVVHRRELATARQRRRRAR